MSPIDLRYWAGRLRNSGSFPPAPVSPHRGDGDGEGGARGAAHLVLGGGGWTVSIKRVSILGHSYMYWCQLEDLSKQIFMFVY